MNTAKLVRMANDIAANFDCGLGRAREVAEVMDHIGRFWSPHMLDTMAGHIQAGGSGLSELAEQALKQLIDERQGS